MKLCKGPCGKRKPLSCFTKNKHKSDGKQSLCKICYNEYLRKWNKNNPRPAGLKNRFNKYYLTINGRAAHMLNNAKRRAKTDGLEFSLDKGWLIDKLTKGLCEVTNIPFELNINGGKGHVTNSFAPSLDRIDNSKGYYQDNVQVVCWIYNRAKGAFPLDDLRRMVTHLKL